MVFIKVTCSFLVRCKFQIKIQDVTLTMNFFLSNVENVKIHIANCLSFIFFHFSIYYRLQCLWHELTLPFFHNFLFTCIFSITFLYNSGPSAGFWKGGVGCGGGSGRGLWISVPRGGSRISGYRGCS